MKRGKEAAHPHMPARIGRYEVLLPIASGGMGTVYLARSSGLGGFQREVALKVMHHHLREEEGFAHDLIEEAKLASSIKHPNVVQVHDVGDDPNGVYLVMDYVEGDSLAGIQRTLRKLNEPLSERIGLRILHDALLGLHAAHELCDKQGEPLGLVHRDFSPQNVLVGRDGVSKLTDFGVAKARTRSSHTATGLVKGKIHYMSPEQARTETIDRRCDVWAAGVIVWELLAQRRLYRERSDTAVLLQLISEPPARLRRVRAEVPQPLEDAVAHALATQVRDRCPTAKQLADELAHGAAAIGGLADHAEVAALIARLAGSSLEVRREQVSEVMKLRAHLASITDAATLDTDTITTPSDLGLSAGRSLERELPPPEEEGSGVTRTSGSLDLPTDRERSKNGLRAIAAVLAVGTIAAAAYVFTRDDDAASPTNALPATTAPIETTSTVIADTTSSVEHGPGMKVAVTANLPVVSITIGSREVVLVPEASAFEIALNDEEQGREQPLVARAADGRIAATTWTPGAAEITLEFGPPIRSGLPAGSRPTGAAVTSGSPVGKQPKTPQKPAPLAPNPFDP